LVVRAVMSWFPIRGDSPFAAVYRVLIDITEPLLAPLRRVIPPAGMFDLSFLVLFFIVAILRGVVCSGSFLGF
jgi:YggT family protein